MGDVLIVGLDDLRSSNLNNSMIIYTCFQMQVLGHLAGVFSFTFSVAICYFNVLAHLHSLYYCLQEGKIKISYTNGVFYQKI